MDIRRRTLRRLLLVGAVVVPLLAVLVAAGLAPGEALPPPTKDLLDRAASKDRDAIADAAGRIERQHQEVIRILIDRLDPRHADRNGPDARAAAAHLLGQLHAVEAGPVLVAALADPRMPENLHPTNGFTDIEFPHRPAYFALMSIGMPAAPALVAEIGRTDDLELRGRLLQILARTVGGKRRLVELLARVEARAADDAAREHVSRARRWVEEFYGAGEEPLFW